MSWISFKFPFILVKTCLLEKYTGTIQILFYLWFILLFIRRTKWYDGGREQVCRGRWRYV